MRMAEMLPNAAFGIEMRLPPRSPTVRKMALLARFHRPIGSSAFPPDAGPSLTRAGCRPWVNSSQLSDRKAAPVAGVHRLACELALSMLGSRSAAGALRGNLTHLRLS